jgi:hypothetical protein
MTWNDVLARLNQLLAEEKKQEQLTSDWIDQMFSTAKLIVDKFKDNWFDPPYEVTFDCNHLEIAFVWEKTANLFRIFPTVVSIRHLRIGSNYLKWVEQQ